MVLYRNIAIRLLVQQWVVVHVLNICGQMVKNIKSQRHYQHHNMLLFLWIGLKDKLITKQFFQYQQVISWLFYFYHVIYILSNILSVYKMDNLITDVPFPKTFVPLCRKILTRLFRVFVHVYIHHFDRIVAIGAVSISHMYLCFSFSLSLSLSPPLSLKL